MASTSNSHSTSTTTASGSPSSSTTTGTTTMTCTSTTSSCSSSAASHCTTTTGEGNESSTATNTTNTNTTAIVSIPESESQCEKTKTPCSSATSELGNNEIETEETEVEASAGKEESTSPLSRPLTDSPKDKADNSSISKSTRKKRKKNNSSCRIIRAGEDREDSCTFSSSSSSESDSEKHRKKRFFRKRENHRKSSLSPFDFDEEVLSSEQDNRKLDLEGTPNISGRRLSRRKSSFFNKFPDLLWGSNKGKNKEKRSQSIPSVNLVEDDIRREKLVRAPERVLDSQKDSLKKQTELKEERRQFIDEQLKGESNETTLSPSEMFSTHYNLRWKNHQSHMLLAFESLLYNESFVDVSLVCSCDDDYEEEEEDEKRIKELNKLGSDEANDDDGGKLKEQLNSNANRNNEEGDVGGGTGSRKKTNTNTHKNETVVTIKAHKIVLSASSEFFQRILAENPCKHPVVILTSFQRWEVQALVDFMYRGEVDVSSERLSSIIKTAESLQIRGLADYAGKFDRINKDEEPIEPHSPLPHQHNLNMSSPPKLPPQIIMNRKTMEGLRRGLDRELVREHRSNSSSIDVDNEGEEDHLEMMRIRRQQRSLSPKLLNLSMGSGGSNASNGGHTPSPHLSSKTESASSSTRNKSNFHREEPQATLGQTRAEPFPPHTNHHHRQKQLRQPDNQEIINNNNGNSNDFLHHYGATNLPGTNHHLNASPMFIPRRKQARPRRRSGDFVAVAQDLRKGNAQPEPLQTEEQSPPQQNQGSRSSSRTPTSTPSQNPNTSSNLNQNHNQVHQNANNHQNLTTEHLAIANHIRHQQNQSMGHSQQPQPPHHHRRSSRHHRRSNNSHHRSLTMSNAHDDMDERENDDMDENQVLDYTTNAGIAFNNNSLIAAAALSHPHPLGMKHWISSTPTPPLNQRISPLKADGGESDDGLTPPPEQCHTPPISPSDPKGYPVDFPLFGLGDHPHLHNNRNLPLFKTSPPSPSSFFLSGFTNANGPLSMSISLTHSDESNNAGDSAATPPNVFSPAGFPMPMGLPLTNSNNNNSNNSHGGPAGLNNSQGQRSSPVGWPGLPLGPAPIFGRHRAQHSAPRGGPPRAWSNADLTEALHNVWNKKMTTSQASRIFGIPYNSLLMYVRGKYGKSLKLDLLKKGLDLALENKANANNAASNAKESNNSSAATNHNHSSVNINNNNNNPASGKGVRLSNSSNNSSPSSQNINNNNISKSKSHHNQHHHHHHPPHHHHSQHSSHHHHHHHQSGAGGSPPLGIGNIGLVGLGEPPDIPAGFNPFTAAASIFGDYPAPFPFASALSHILPPGSLMTPADKVALNDDDK